MEYNKNIKLMDTIVRHLSPLDVFLVETSTGTKQISAANLNYVSQQFNKILNQVDVLKLNTNETRVQILSSLSFKLINNTNTITTSGVFNSLTINSGVVTSAYNVYDSLTNSLSTTVNNTLSSISANVFNVFFDSGSAVLDYHIFQSGFGSVNQLIEGTKTVPAGVQIGAQDITFKILFNSGIGNLISSTGIILPSGINSSFTLTTAYPVAYVTDKDYDLEYFNDEVPDYDNNYVNGAGKVSFRINIINNPLFPPTGIVRVVWKAQKFY